MLYHGMCVADKQKQSANQKSSRKIINLALVLCTNTPWHSLLPAVVPGNLFLQPGRAGLGSSADSWENRLDYSSPGPLIFWMF